MTLKMSVHLFHPWGELAFQHICFSIKRCHLAVEWDHCSVHAIRRTMGSELTMNQGILKAGKHSPNHLKQRPHFRDAKTIIQRWGWTRSLHRLSHELPNWESELILIGKVAPRLDKHQPSGKRRLSPKVCSYLHKYHVSIWYQGGVHASHSGYDAWVFHLIWFYRSSMEREKNKTKQN